MRAVLLVLTVILAAAAVSVAAGATGATGTPSSGTNVLVVMNPSKRAITTEVRHVKEIFGQVSTLPGLGFLGIYEQRSSDDGPPFDRPFVMTQTPTAAKRPTLMPLDPCRETEGTSYQQSVCKKRHEETRAENAERIAAWNARNRSILAGWRTQVRRQIDTAGRTTEESKRWDLPGALTRAGANLRAMGSRQNCLVLLGGLAVQPPPTRVDLSSLKGTKLLVTGWRSTEQVKTLWTNRMRNVGATIEFLPADVTDFILKDAVTRCTTMTA
jgi:hypothetical protein